MRALLKISQPKHTLLLYHWNFNQWVEVTIIEHGSQQLLLSTKNWYSKEGRLLPKYSNFTVDRHLDGKTPWSAWRGIKQFKNLDGSPL